MKRILFALGVIAAALNLAAKEPPTQQSAEKNEDRNALTPVAPPPGMNEAGVEAIPAIAPKAPESKASNDAINPAASSAAVAGAAELPVITVRKQGDDTVEEYRKHGQLYMIRILPKDGPTKFYVDRAGDGRLERDPREGPISPVYFKLYEWK